MVPDEELEELPLPGWDDAIDAPTLELFTNYLARNAEAVGLLHQAATIESCRYDIDLSKDLVQASRLIND